MSGEPASIGVCPECGAENPVTAARCWMCGRQAWGRPAAKTASDASTPQSDVSLQPTLPDSRWLTESESPPPVARSESATRILVLVATGLVITGVWFESHGIALLLAGLLGVPLLITLGTAMSRDARYRKAVSVRHNLTDESLPPQPPAPPMSTGEQAGMFVKWVAIATGSALVAGAVFVIILAIMILSVVAAFFEACAKLGGS